MAQIKQHAEELAQQLKQVFGERLLSVCLFGETAKQRINSQEDSKKLHTLPIEALVIIRDFTTKDLHFACPPSLWWEKSTHALPLYLSETEWQNANDVFALEYANIKDWHCLIYGQDFFSDIIIDKQALRMICEEEIFRKLIFLRQRLLLFRQKPEILLKLLQEGTPSFNMIFRGILNVCNVNADDNLSPHQAIAKLVPEFKSQPFDMVQQAVPKNQIVSLFETYVEQISLVNAFLNLPALACQTN